MPPKYRITLTDAERDYLRALVTKGRTAARRMTHAHILLHTDRAGATPPRTDTEISTLLHISTDTIARVRQRCVEDGLEAALTHTTTPRPRARRLDGTAEAHLIALACSAAPEGRSVWTMQLLADRLVALGVVDRVSDETVRTTLKKTTSNRG